MRDGNNVYLYFCPLNSTCLVYLENFKSVQTSSLSKFGIVNSVCFTLPPPNIQISFYSLHLDFLTDQKPLIHSYAEQQAPCLYPLSLPGCVWSY